jgi:Transposase DNA-binding
MIAPWAKEEVEEADWGDERLHARLERVLSALGNRPNLSIPAACGGRTEMVGAYRFFNNEKVTFDKAP